jgi:3-oxoacyl-[acyl-carrier protein] reductase
MTRKRSALVTGAGRGIGRAIAVALAGHGFDVVVNYHRNAQAAQECAAAIGAAGGRAELAQADIGRADDRRRLVEEAVAQFGGIDLLVNNAGVAPTTRADLLETSEESFDRVLGTNLKGTFFLTQPVARQMIAQAQMEAADARPARSIINITSVSAYAASVNRGEYCIAKAGLAMLTKLFALRLAEHGIGVYEIRPGIIATDMTAPVKAKYDQLILEENLLPIKRWGTPEDVAKAVLAVTNGMLPYSTGQVLDVDGGFHIPSL